MLISVLSISCLSDVLTRLADSSRNRYVELLDKYFGSVCELDIIFNYEKAYFMLDELLLVRGFRLSSSLGLSHYVHSKQGGEMQETSKKNILKAVTTQDLLQEESENSKDTLDDMMALS